MNLKKLKERFEERLDWEMKPADWMDDERRRHAKKINKISLVDFENDYPESEYELDPDKIWKFIEQSILEVLEEIEKEECMQKIDFSNFLQQADKISAGGSNYTIMKVKSKIQDLKKQLTK